MNVPTPLFRNIKNAMQIQSFYHSASLKTQEAFKSLQKPYTTECRFSQARAKRRLKRPTLARKLLSCENPARHGGIIYSIRRRLTTRCITSITYSAIFLPSRQPFWVNKTRY
ncbi:hypothetical protein CW188_000631 [Salmonella enterica subsp. enterica serovar Cerro]|nr:hypothetical protein [Salmonella enterica subsp. enterica serovar Cerro]